MKKTVAFVLAFLASLAFLVNPGFGALPRYEIIDLGTLGSDAEYAMLKFQGTHSQPLRVPADYQTIQAAIDAAVDSDVVIVAPGLYSGDGNRDIDFNGKAITVRSIDPNDPNIVAATIIDCNGTETDMHRGFCFHNDEDANSLLDGFTITNGYMHGYPEPANGGGICCEQSSPTILNCTITRNSAGRAGGGIFCDFSSNPRIANCNINENWVVSDGGGIFCYRSSPTIINCVIKSNIALFEGGGVYCHENSRAIINNCIIADNVASYYNKGGGIMCRVISHRFPA